MLIVKLWNFFRGYVVIKIEGLALEKFINFAIAKGIYLWDIVRIDYTTLEAKIGLKGYKELRHIVKRAGCRVKISQKIGYPFFMHKISARKMFIIGFIISIFIIVFATSFIWDIEIIGNQDISKEEIKEHLNTLGLYRGVFKYKLDISDIENNMMIELKNLAWVGIQIQGTKAIIEVVEKVDPPKKIPKDIPCDIVAIKKGVIEKIIAKNGDALVQKGDIVKKGQILITGVIQREGLETRYVHALGDVFAKTYYEENDKISLVRIKKVKTGNKVERKIIKIGNNQIISSLGEIPYNNVIIEKRNKSFTGWRNIKIPVEIIIEEYYEAIEKKEIIDKSTAKKALQERMMVNLVKKMPKNVKILNKDIKFYQEGNIIRAKLTIEALEQIGKKQRISTIN
ncbi:sporulation protein YqfD [Crassaminicella thermophila]|uniref:Sporulation protein YqfD n=1 Tax=Crassaminicella thermophila TaxID=2599308 RepID=A0A5C0SGK7_CRATE|nr:sporulation protein YqfD [Crassaminicella thermophila]QEK12358.1 sporulation protein YqfD [Crassaminicella thermophila]